MRAEARSLKEKTIYKYRLLFRQLEKFAELKGIHFLKDLNNPALRQFRGTWKDGNLASLKKLERLRAFFRFACGSKWIVENPVTGLKNPKVSARPTTPFTHDEMVQILRACGGACETSRLRGKANARRLRALVLLLRYSGLRIGDAASCISGASKLQTAIGDWQAELKKIFEKAKIPDGHAHRFRDTFPVELLLAGVPLERISIFLGHTSIRITERDHAPWVRARQKQAEVDVRRAWAHDPLALLESKGTPEVHGKSAAVN